MRVVATQIWPDGTMGRRMVDTALLPDARQWEELASRALAVTPPYQPVPGTALYHVSIDDHVIMVGESDLAGPLLDLVTAVMALGDEM
jgi:hypothetical protein